MNIYQSKNLAVITISRLTIEGIQPATGLRRRIVPLNMDIQPSRNTLKKYEVSQNVKSQSMYMYKGLQLRKKVDAINKVCTKLDYPHLSATIRELSYLSLCHYTDHPTKKCVVPERMWGLLSVQHFLEVPADCATTELPDPSWWQ